MGNKTTAVDRAGTIPLRQVLERICEMVGMDFCHMGTNASSLMMPGPGWLLHTDSDKGRLGWRREDGNVVDVRFVRFSEEHQTRLVAGAVLRLPCDVEQVGTMFLIQGPHGAMNIFIKQCDGGRQ